MIKKYKIKVYKQSKSSSGHAVIKSRNIKIPKPTNTDRLAVCFHEVAHIHYGRMSHRFIEEYYADMFALEHLKILGLPTEAWIHRTKWHVMMMLAKANNRGLDWKNVPAEMLEFIKCDVSNWKGNSVFVTHSKDGDHIVSVKPKEKTNYITLDRTKLIYAGQETT